MDHLSIVAQVVIVAGAALAGPLVVFLLSLVVAILLRAAGAADGPPPIALALAGRIRRRMRASLGRAAGEEVPGDIIRRAPAGMTHPAPTPP